MKNVNSLATKLLVVFCLIAFLLPLMQQGMFVDGITYSAVSNNLANGIGNYLTPHYSQTLYPQFHEHPPLVFIIQSLFFEVLGDHYLVERLYCFVIILLTMTGIARLWGLYADSKDQKTMLWLPLLLWMTVPIVWWSYTNNMLENTMAVFNLFAAYFLIKAIKSHKQLYLVWASICIVLAFLCKGSTGLFPLVIPVIYGVVYGFSYNIIKTSVLIVAATMIVSFCFYQFVPGLEESMLAYFDRQLLPALSNEREITTSNRFKILWQLLLDASILILITILIFFGVKSAKKITTKTSKSNFLFFVLIGLSASLPLIVVLKQRKFYLIPSIPFYALACSLLIVEGIELLVANIKWKRYQLYNSLAKLLVGLVLIVVSLNLGKYDRDEDLIKDVTAISENIPNGSIIGAEQKMMTEWSLIAYLTRIGYISLSTDFESDYILVEGNSRAEIPFGYSPINIELINYRLYRKN